MVDFPRPHDTAKTRADTTRHPLFQRDIRLNAAPCRELLDRTKHRHRAACKDHIRRQSLRLDDIHDISLRADTAVLRRDMYRRILCQILRQEKLLVPITDDHIDGCGIPDLTGKQEHRRNTDTAAHQKDSLSLSCREREPVSERSEYVHAVPCLVARELCSPFPRDAVDDAQPVIGGVCVADADRTRQKRRPVLCIHADKLSRLCLPRKFCADPHVINPRCDLLLPVHPGSLFPFLFHITISFGIINIALHLSYHKSETYQHIAQNLLPFALPFTPRLISTAL